ncbi:MAG TPA: 3-carboxy-cis,cis-muconate cycloisomerase [Terriglobia bacterium]|nr:3-carboxy-cis,cis-muconate cycloisomerase [Terriglobia bacterium]
MASSRLLASLATTKELADLFSDQSVLAALLRFESALSRAQAQLGIVPASAADAISRAGVANDFNAEAIARDARLCATIVIPLVKALTARVAAHDPIAARFVHWGATSQDAVDTAMSLLLSRAKPILARDHAHMAQSLRALSEAHAKTVMLGRTLLQPAPPITFGYKVAGWYGGVQRSWRRLDTSFSDAVTLQFGGAAGTLAAYGQQGIALAAALGKELNLPVANAPWHAHRDRMAALIADCGIYTGALGKIARDVSLLMQHEVGEVAEAGGRSSAMPHKRNPAGSVVALAAATRMPGLVAAFLAGMVQEHERAAGGWQAEWPIVSDVIETTGSALAAIAGAIDGLTVYPDRMRANLGAARGVIFAEKVRMLIQAAIGRETAENLLADAARQALKTSRSFLEMLRTRPEVASLLTAEQLDNIDCAEDYLGAAEEFRKNLLEG